jgi:hypothetical protein
MPSDPPARRDFVGPASRLGLAAALLAVCLAPHLQRLKYPSLYADDVMRVAFLQRESLREAMFRPFNEHMAPMFEAVSSATWLFCSRRLVDAPLAFTVASFVPFVLSLGLLWLAIRREFGSATTAWGAMALFSLSSLASETVLWYSASSFMWALLWALAAWVCAQGLGRATGRASAVGWGLGATLAAALAPASSAIGVLAGPLGAIRLLAAPSDEEAPAGRRRARIAAAVPMLGTLLYLAVCSRFRYREVVADSVRRNADLAEGLRNVARAAVNVLVPGPLGPTNYDPWMPDALSLALFGLGLAGALAWALRSRRHRAAILGGLWLIAGGYALTYVFRTTVIPIPVLRIQRYHLFPHLGLVLALAPLLRAALSRLDARPTLGLAAALALAAALLQVHSPQMRGRARFFRFPEQRPALAAMDRLAVACADRRISREQALAAMDPVTQTRWFPFDQFNALTMLPPTVESPSLPGPLVRPTLLGALSEGDRRALWGGPEGLAKGRPRRDEDEGRGRARR